MLERLLTLEQIQPLPTAEEVLAQNPRSVVSIAPDADAAFAARLMAENDIGFLAVLEGAKLVGVLSERDIARRADLGRAIPVAEIMRTRVHTAAPQSKITECLAIMHREHIRHLPVVRDDALQGVLSMRDLMGAAIERHERLLRRFEQERYVLHSPNTGSY